MAEIAEDASRLVSENTGPLFRGALAMGFSESDAEELVQETFVTYWKAKDRFQGRSSLRTFLFGILYNKGAELSRKKRREIAVDDVEAAFDSRFDARGHWLADQPKGPEDAAMAEEISAILAKCAENLTSDQRSAFFLKEVEGASPEEICNILGVRSTNLRVLLFRARLRLRDCLERNWGRR